MGRRTGSRNVFSPEKTRAMKRPSGLVTANSAMKKSPICSQPFAVMVKTSRARAAPPEDIRTSERKFLRGPRCPSFACSSIQPVAGPYISQRYEKEGRRACHEYDIENHDDPFAGPRLMVTLAGENTATPLLLLPATIGFAATGVSRIVNILAVGRSAVMRTRCFGLFIELIASRVN